MATVMAPMRDRTTKKVFIFCEGDLAFQVIVRLVSVRRESVTDSGHVAHEDFLYQKHECKANAQNFEALLGVVGMSSKYMKRFFHACRRGPTM